MFKNGLSAKLIKKNCFVAGMFQRNIFKIRIRILNNPLDPDPQPASEDGFASRPVGEEP